MIRVGILGVGFGAAVHLPALLTLPNVKVHALGAHRPEKARDLAEKHGIEMGGSADEVLDMRLDAVTVALPPLQGARAVLRALDQRLAVLTEKPLAESLATAREIVGKSTGLTCAVGFELAELNCFRALKRELEVGGGSVRALKIAWHSCSYAHRHRIWNWKLDRERHGGVMNLAGPHVLFLIEWLVGRLAWLSATFSTERTRRIAPPGALAAEDAVALQARTTNGILIEVELQNAADRAEHSWTVELDGELLLLEEQAEAQGKFLLKRQGLRTTQVIADDQPCAGDWRIEPFRRLASRFVECAAQKTHCHPDFVEGLRVQRLIEAARLSAASNGTGVDIAQMSEI